MHVLETKCRKQRLDVEVMLPIIRNTTVIPSATLAIKIRILARNKIIIFADRLTLEKSPYSPAKPVIKLASPNSN